MIQWIPLLLLGCSAPPPDDAAQFAIQFRSPTRYLLEPDDTLAGVAERWGVSEEDLASWNPGFADLEPGSVVLLHVPPGTTPREAPAPTPAPRGRRSTPRSRCKAIRGDGDMVAAKGLSSGQIQGTIRKRFGRLSRCVPSSLSGTYEAIVEIDVGCDGRVTNTYTISPGALSGNTMRCIERVFRSTRFPAHDMPDGMSFQYPLTFER